jgi:hypothetical protein
VLALGGPPKSRPSSGRHGGGGCSGSRGRSHSHRRLPLGYSRFDDARNRHRAVVKSGVDDLQVEDTRSVGTTRSSWERGPQVDGWLAAKQMAFATVLSLTPSARAIALSLISSARSSWTFAAMLRYTGTPVACVIITSTGIAAAVRILCVRVPVRRLADTPAPPAPGGCVRRWPAARAFRRCSRRASRRPLR